MISSKYHNPKRNSQVSLEFLFYIIAIILAITTYSLILFTKYDLKEEVKEDSIQHFLNDIRDLIEYVYAQGSGFYVNYTFPYQILNNNYVISFSNNLILLDIQNITYTIALSIDDINITVTPGKKHKIENREGVIYVFPYY